MSEPVAGAPRTGVYTVLIGRYEQLNEQPMARESGLPFLCLTDDPDVRSETWEIRHVRPLFPADPVRSQRELKLRPHLHLPELDRSLYIDNSIVLTAPPEAILARAAGAPFAASRHDGRATLRDEFGAVLQLRRDADERILEQLADYEATVPELLAVQPWLGGILVRDHRDPLVIATMELWLAHLLRYSRRDQLSLPVVLAETGLVPHDLGLPMMGSSLHRWPVRVDRVAPPPMRPGPVTTLVEALALQDAERAATAERIASLEREAAEARAQAGTLAARVAEVERVNAEVQGSTTWRITAPVRATLDALKATPAAPPVRRIVQALRDARTVGGRQGLRRAITNRRHNAWYAFFPLVCALQRRRHGPRFLPVGPGEVTRPHLLWKLARVRGIDLVGPVDPPGLLAWRHEHATIATRPGPAARTTINGAGLDISKQRVEAAMLAVFGYGTAVDPRTHLGPLVDKSDENATHDGVIRIGPIADPEPGRVYQRVVDNEVAPGIVEDIRVLVVGDEVPALFRKRRRIEERFRDTGFPARSVPPGSVLRPDEIARIVALVREMGIDVAELDVARDRGDGRLHVLDVNTTPYSPPGTLHTPAGWWAMLRAGRAFERQWGSQVARGEPPPGTVRIP